MRTVTQWLVVGTLTTALAGRAIAAGVFVYPQRGQSPDQQKKRLQGVTNTWNDVQGAFDYWSERVRARLAEFRAGRGPT